jgi:hypothetical protein
MGGVLRGTVSPTLHMFHLADRRICSHRDTSMSSLDPVSATGG